MSATLSSQILVKHTHRQASTFQICPEGAISFLRVLATSANSLSIVHLQVSLSFFKKSPFVGWYLLEDV